MRRFLPSVLLLLPALIHAADKPVPPELLKGLEDKDPRVRIAAIKGLSKLGPEAAPPLVKAMRDPEKQVSNAAMYVLGVLRVEPKLLVAALEPYIKDDSLAVRMGVTKALRNGSAPAVRVLQIALADKEESVRIDAVRSLGVIVKKTPATAKEMMPALTKAVADPSTVVRVLLAQTLGNCGVEGLAPTLALIDDADAKVRAYALNSLKRMKNLPPEKVIAVVAKRAKDDPEVIVRQSALQTLGALGKAAVPAVVAALSDKNPAVQKAAVGALAAIGKEATAAVPALKETAAKADNPAVRSAAVAALGTLGKEGEEAVADLLGRDDSVTRLACLQHLGKQGKAPKSAVPDLIKALADRDPDVRVLAAHVLGLIGADAKSALPALQKAAQDEDKNVGMIAEKAIKTIKGE